MTGLYFNSPPITTDCPEVSPAPTIDAEEAKRILARSYAIPSLYSFSLEEEVKFCTIGGSWWVKTDTGAWDSLSRNRVPNKVVAHAARQPNDQYFYVIGASHNGPGMSVYDGWVDGITSELVVRIRIAS